MKIFAKRKRTSAAGAAGASSTPNKNRDSFASDPLVEELLKKDPKEWNSKERRMIKRHQERRVGENDQETSTTPGDRDAVMVVEQDNKHTAPSKHVGQDENEESSGDDSNTEGRSDHDSFGTSEDIEDAPVHETTDALETGAVSNETVMESTKVEGENDEDKVDSSHEVYTILDQLNSKTKRTLTRKLERGGVAVVDEVLKEAQKALSASTEASVTDSKKPVADNRDGGDSEDKPSNKKSKKEFLSSLSPEERLRREEQRRKQQEAAERRARGEDKTPGYKHPLNSERRRANKRKPKWTSASVSGTGVKVVKNEHHHSGYLHRKQV
jgi:hypothetical protein